ncbi:MAG: GMC family oxidoreductase [Actinomycetes bacterium]
MTDYDVIIVGSGFGGSVSALRLAEKGYSVLVLEAGKRFEDKDFPKTSWRIKDFLFAPQLGCLGIQRIHALPDVMVLAGAGVGGGSLVYANTMYEPPAEFFEQGPWVGITDWQSELTPFYELARNMLGVTDNPLTTPADEAMRTVAARMGVGDTYRSAPVAVHFGTGPGQESTDPYFGGIGPTRSGCTHCGECMTGCRHNAKNTLVKNYLALAEHAGVTIEPLSTVKRIENKGDTWLVSVRDTAGVRHRMLSSTHVIVAAGTYGTQRLLHRMKDEGVLPNISARLGFLSRTNSESLIGAVAKKSPTPDFTTGVAITSSFFPDQHTHIQPVRYGVGSNSMALLSTALCDFSDSQSNWKTWLKMVCRKPFATLKALYVSGWSQRTVIALVMQSVDNSLTVFGEKDSFGSWRLRTKPGEGVSNPSWIPVAHEVAKELANVIEGKPMGNLGEVFDAPFTAHFVGGATIAADSEHGVVDAYHRVFGYRGLHIVDGSTISANLGVNPSLTITAQAERAMSMWPNKNQTDSRPDSGYVPIAPIAPQSPVVPQHVTAALFY